MDIGTTKPSQPVIPGGAGDPDFVLSLARGLQVIEAFYEPSNGKSVSEIAATTGLSRASVRRLLITLEQLGYAERNGSLYRLTSRVMRLGFSYLSSSSLASLALPLLERLSAAIQESCSVSVLDGNEIVYIARSAPKRVMAVDLAVGSRLPAWCTSMGRVLLSGLPSGEVGSRLAVADVRRLTPKTIVDRGALLAVIEQTRLQGHALVDEELETGLRSIAVPVPSKSGGIVAAMNTGVHASRISSRELRDRILPVLSEHAKLLGQLQH